MMEQQQHDEDVPCCIKEEEPTSGALHRCEDPRPDDHVSDVAQHSHTCHSLRTEMNEPMQSIGPWATGKCDWNPSSGLVGVKPIVDHYSITRFSTNEWAQRNEDIYKENHEILRMSVNTEHTSKDTMSHAAAMVDHNQENSTKRLKERTHDVYKLKTTLERAIKAQMDEFSSLSEQRNRLMHTLNVLQLPESIATECIERRSRRPESELIRDGPEEDLIEEIALISEIRNVINLTLNDVNNQLASNRAARERLESDWSDKKHAYEIDSNNCSLNNKSKVPLFKPGATRYMDEQSTECGWEEFTRKALVDCEENRQRSIKLRETIDAILINAARDLRTKADNVVRAFNRRISTMEDARMKLETELIDCLKRLAETERLIETLNENQRNLDNPMKVAQTRLDNRNRRLNVENCRDRAHIGLVDEVHHIEEAALALSLSIKEAEDRKTALMQTRGLLERELMLKRRTIEVDKERCTFFRSHFPSTTTLSGYT